MYLCIATVLNNRFITQIYEEILLDFPKMLRGSDILVTGDDEFDAQSYLQTIAWCSF